MLGIPRGGGGGGVDCSTGSPAVGALCLDGTYFVGTVTVNGSSYKLATTPGNCGYEPSGSASTVVSSTFTPTCSGGYDTMSKNTTSITPVSGADQVSSSTAASTVGGAVSSNKYIATPAASYCEYMNYGGKTDWFLPNKTELHFLACRSTTSANAMNGTSEDVNCATSGYGSGSNIVPGFIAGTTHPSGYQVYTSSTSYTWAGSTLVMEQTSNWASSGTQGPLGVGSPFLVRCVRVIP
jgi:hypothetical protein